MKRYIYSIAIILLGLITSCVTLDTEPTDMSTSASFFSDETEVGYALNAVYDKLGSIYLYGGGDCLSSLFDVADQMWRSTSPSISSYNYSASEVRVSYIWRDLYIGIERANILLKNIENADMDEGEKNGIIGEAKFLRAYYYFLLVQNFGAVPLKTEPTQSVNDIYIERTDASVVYDFVYAEMKDAEALVSSISNYSYAERVTKSAVQGILSRVSLYMAGFPNNANKTDEQIKECYTNALTWAEKVINSGLHELNPDYSQIFINLIQNQYDTKESIWEIGYYSDGASGIYTSSESGTQGVNNGISQYIQEYGFSGAQYRIQPKLYAAFESNDQYQDVRRDWCIAPFRYKTFANPPVKEYWSDVFGSSADNPNRTFYRNVGKFRREYELGTDKIKNYTSTNNPLLRYSDVLLMAAEADNELNGPTAKAIEYINLVRNRAHASPIENVAGQVEFRKIIQDERYRELCFEGFRRMDLIRWGILIEEMREMVDWNILNRVTASVINMSGVNVSEKDYYIPIPVREISLDPLLTQNPGW